VARLRLVAILTKKVAPSYRQVTTFRRGISSGLSASGRYVASWAKITFRVDFRIAARTLLMDARSVKTCSHIVEQR
jgi:hypothetical protein